jgi:hypothetical protein
MQVPKKPAQQSPVGVAMQQQEIKVSDLPAPRTSSDFKAMCKRMKSDASALSEYIQRIPPGSYKKLFKSDLDTVALDSFAEVLLHRVKSDPDWCKACMKSLQRVERYDLQRAMSSSLGRKFSEIESAISLT